MPRLRLPAKRWHRRKSSKTGRRLNKPRRCLSHAGKRLKAYFMFDRYSEDT